MFGLELVSSSKTIEADCLLVVGTGDRFESVRDTELLVDGVVRGVENVKDPFEVPKAPHSTNVTYTNSVVSGWIGLVDGEAVAEIAEFTAVHVVVGRHKG